MTESRGETSATGPRHWPTDILPTWPQTTKLPYLPPQLSEHYVHKAEASSTKKAAYLAVKDAAIFPAANAVMSRPRPSSRTASTTRAAPPLQPSALPADTVASRQLRPLPTGTSQNSSLRPEDARSRSRDSTVRAPHAKSGAIEDSHDGAATEEEEDEHARPAFEPFFTLVEDSQSSTTHHPAVHYIFSDDDGDVLNDTLLRLSAKKTQEENLPPGQKGSSKAARERYIVVNVGEDGKSVSSAQSLTGDWQVLGSEISAAPMLEGEEGETGGLMLRVQGTAGIRDELAQVGEKDIESAIERYRERMEELKRIVEAGKPSEV